MPMLEDDRKRWERLAAYRFDDPLARLTFTARLARENGWTTGYALRIIQEYRRTIESYTATFDAPPPQDIWPGPESRFGDDLAWRRVNRRRNWVIPKPARFLRPTAVRLRLWAGQRLALWCGIGLALVCGVGFGCGVGLGCGLGLVLAAT
ncbi:MAG: hypothetical protein RLY70_3246 [Planctomycetota bacterium]